MNRLGNSIREKKKANILLYYCLGDSFVVDLINNLNFLRFSGVFLSIFGAPVGENPLIVWKSSLDSTGKPTNSFLKISCFGKVVIFKFSLFFFIFTTVDKA